MIFSRVCLLLLLTVVGGLAEPLKVKFRHPHPAGYRIEEAKAKPGVAWIEALPDGSTNLVELGDRVVIQVEDPKRLTGTLRGRSLKIARQISPTLFILQTADALTAINEAEALSVMPGVTACYPVTRQRAELNAAFAPLPNDIFFYRFLSTGNGNGIWGQWNLENRTFEGDQMGMDIGIRGAWPYSRGEGVTVAVADSGVETTHPELLRNTAGAPHFNFANGTTNIIPTLANSSWAHGTLVSGIIAAQANNSRGISGIAYDSKLAGWVIFQTNTLLVGEEQLMDMYQFRSNIVSIQNHSWAKSGSAYIRPMGLLESTGFSNAIYSGRSGLGSIIVRAAGNRRDSLSPDDRGETANRWAFTVAAARYDGRVASYSEPGASVLIAAPSGDFDFPYLFTTDLMGTRGYNQINFFNSDLNDYAFNSLGFSGTSGAAPHIAGIAALILSANPTLSYRDVQQVLIHSGKHWDLADPDLRTNSAGLRVSHNLGYGIPNAGEAVRLAGTWQNRPALTKVSLIDTNQTVIPDAGLRVIVSGQNLPSLLASIVGEPTQRGPHPDSPTLALPLADVGSASNTIPQDLTGYGGVSVRDSVGFATKIDFSAAAGAQFLIVCNNATNPVFSMSGTDFVTIPAVAIPKIEGELLRTYMTTNVATARLELNSASYSFAVTNMLSCEHVGVRVKSNHPERGDLRITLTSPGGTRSVLQILNQDIQPIPPQGWTYFSTHHFYESSAGTWTVAITDECAGTTGLVQEVELMVWGTALDDTDHDGLSDNWETAQFGTLVPGAKDDPDKDDYNNLREQILGTNPQLPNAPLLINLSSFNSGYFRAGWPSSTQFDYEVFAGTNLNNLSLVTNLSGQFPETDWIFPATNSAQFVRIVQKNR